VTLQLFEVLPQRQQQTKRASAACRRFQESLMIAARIGRATLGLQ
jgi:hypothetical protein